MSEADHLWTAVAQILKAQVSEAVWHSSFQDVRPLELTATSMTVAVPSSYVRERIEGRYLPLVRDALADVGHPELELRIQVHTETAPVVEQLSVFNTTFDEPTPTAPEPVEERPELPTTRDGLNPRYTFEAFVTGASNRFAHAAALRVAETPAKSYNPLFIYGAAGLGKTHLLHAIGHYVRNHYAHYEVRYISTEAFMNEYVDAIRTNTTASFKRRYREVDVLMIDDIQFMEGKEGLQEEFFHTFNSLHGANRQIVISSDRPPDAIPTLEDRLRGRFKWGLMTDIQPPDLETRLAILRNKAERDAANVPAEVLEFIASNITNNIRELEGALIRVSAFASLHREPLTMATAEKVLADILLDHQPRSITPDLILDETARMFNFSIDALKGKSRHRPLVTARQIGMYVFRELTELSYPAIAREFGGRDHTTVIHAVEKVTLLMKERKQIYDQVAELIGRIKTGEGS
ncbi:MAG: chromosomal replication initiator protein DnaA [Acidimicrobiia bacterium]